MPAQKKFRLTKTQENDLREKLSKTLFTLVTLLCVLIITLVFFAPKLGVFLGFFSTHKNDKDPLDTIKPSPPLLVNVPKASREYIITLNGFAPEGLTIYLFVNGPKADSTLVGTDGQFTFNNVQLIDGSNIIFVKAVDQSNNESDPSPTFTISVDKESPKIEIESPKDGAIVRNLDKRTIIRGKISEKAQIFINEKIAVQRPDFSFEFLLGLIDGDNEITITATDEAGNETKERLKIKYVKGS